MAELTPMELATIVAGEKNAARSGKGLRLAVASTRGKNPTPVTYESFDESKPDTLPETIAEFMQLSSVEDEATIVRYLITGYNDDSFRLASDPVAEFVEASWPDEVQASFKAAVKQLVKAGIGDVETVVAMVKPGVVAKFSSR